MEFVYSSKFGAVKISSKCREYIKIELVMSKRMGNRAKWIHLLSVMERWTKRTKIQCQKKTKQKHEIASHLNSRSVPTMSCKKMPTVYPIVNLICNKMRKLNFKLNYFQPIFTLKRERPCFLSLQFSHFGPNRRAKNIKELRRCLNANGNESERWWRTWHHFEIL